jgi:hypothetical protein
LRREDAGGALEGGRPAAEGEAADHRVGDAGRAHHGGQGGTVRAVGCDQGPPERAEVAEDLEQARRRAAVLGPALPEVYDDRPGGQSGHLGAIGLADVHAQIRDDRARAGAPREREHLIDLVLHDQIRPAIAHRRIGRAHQQIRHPESRDQPREIPAVIRVADPHARAGGTDEFEIGGIGRERDREIDVAEAAPVGFRAHLRGQHRDRIHVGTVLHHDRVVAAADDRDVRIGKRRAHRRDRGRGKDQIADAIRA